jgi:hypothetical protein
VGRITPAGKVTFFPVPTLYGTRSLISGPAGRLWFAAGPELGAISTTGAVRWPSCLVTACNFPPAALAAGPDGRLWVASGEGHCSEFCGGGSEIAFRYFPGGLGPFALPPLTLGIGPRLAPIRHRHTSVLLACGQTACRGVLRLRAVIVIGPHHSDRTSRLVLTLPYSLAAGESRLIRLPLRQQRLTRMYRRTGYLVLTAVRGSSIIARRGFFFAPRRGGTAEL